MKLISVDRKPNADEHEEGETIVASSTTNQSSSPGESADAIREVILGPKIREDERRFRTIERELERLAQLDEERSVAVEIKLNETVEELNAEIDKGLREIDKRTNERLDQAVSRGEGEFHQVSTLIETLAQELRDKIDKLSNSCATQIEELRDQMRRNYDTLRGELITETDTLDDSKVNRFTLADSLIALGMKLKDEEVLDELNTKLADGA
jgi:hypothetical protein